MVGNLIGMALPSWAKWAAIGVVVLAVALWIGILKGQVSHYKGKVAELEVWQSQAIAAGKAAEAESKRKEQAYVENIKKASASAARVGETPRNPGNTFFLGSHLCRVPQPKMSEMLADMEILKKQGFNLIKIQTHWIIDEPLEGQERLFAL